MEDRRRLADAEEPQLLPGTAADDLANEIRDGQASPDECSPNFGILVGRSKAMQDVFDVLRRAASTDATLLIEGETGTGKEATAASIHRASPRGKEPLLVIDCGAIAPNLLEAELFGHERGAFTGASDRRLGAFEAGAGGTVLLDEIGELPLELQPKLLRVLEQRQIRRLGSTSYRPISVRFLAATNRDLRAQVERGQFRADLFFRLAVMRVRLPAVRERPDDIPVLVRHLLRGFGASERLLKTLDRERLTALQQERWPGNVRELRNYIECCSMFDKWLPLPDEVRLPGSPPPRPRSQPLAPAGPESPLGEAADGATEETAVSYVEARRRALERWEDTYLREQLYRNGGDVPRAARAAGIGRAYMYRLLSRHRITAGGRDPHPLPAPPFVGRGNS